ncbi:MAG: acyl-ACP--UDP-N-acetylglucosamine O-acyltransferase [Chitinophagales bacterium]|nr:acyl-ACP--UDP-N-acetylglucosamine O-acyltransferase [Chitinophagales bacterium]MCZ2392798.1 acyl-ACP--UDP-N-acetylglucosamine O-acyltransferase [Chitinophagales bacterium]
MNNLNYINPKAQIANNVQIGAFSYIDEDVVIGEGTIIEPNVTIYRGTRIGRNCHIFPGAVIGAIPQDLKFAGEYTTVEIGDYTTIRECSTINRGTIASGTTRIGTHNLIMAYVHIAHDCVIGNHCILSNATNLAGHIVVEDFVVFGGMCAAHQFLKIGKHAFIAGGTMLRKDVPPYILAAKDPAVFTGINSLGLKRRNFSLEQVHLIQDVYRYLFNSGLNTTQAIDKILEDFEWSEIREEIITFISNSERGIVKGIS